MKTDNAIEKPNLLIVDDTPENLWLLNALLKGHYRIRLTGSGAQALEVARSAPPPDLILLDIVMPKMDGYEVCTRLKEDPATRDIPVIFLTGRSSPEDEERGILLGAVDYITKPISPAVLKARVATHLNQKAMTDFLRNRSEFLASLVSKRTREIEAAHDVPILSMASLGAGRERRQSG